MNDLEKRKGSGISVLDTVLVAGAVIVGGNPTHRGDELARDLSHTECQLLVTDATLLPLVDRLDLGAAIGLVHPANDRVLVVDTNEALQLQRLMARDSVNTEQARAILAAQADRATRLSAADDVLVNSGTVPELRHAVDLLHERYLKLANAAPA